MYAAIDFVEGIHVHLALVHLLAYARMDGKVFQTGGVQHAGEFPPFLFSFKAQAHFGRETYFWSSFHLLQQGGHACGVGQYAASAHQFCLHGGRASHVQIHFFIAMFLYCVGQAVELIRVRTDDLRNEVQPFVVLRKDVPDVLFSYATLLPSYERSIVGIHSTAMPCVNSPVFKIRVSLQRGKVYLHACILSMQR